MSTICGKGRKGKYLELWQTWEIEREKGEGKSPQVIEQSRHCDEQHEKEKRLVDAADDNYFLFFMIITFFLLMMITYILLLLPIIL